MAKAKNSADKRSNRMTTQASTRKLRSTSRAEKASAVACHMVLETAELLEMTLLCVYNPHDHFRQKLPGDLSNHGVENASIDENVSNDTATGSHSTDGDSVQEKEFADGLPEFEDVYNQEEAVRDMRTLLLCQRVNRMFKSTIDGSSKLQRALWFEHIYDIADDESEAGKNAERSDSEAGEDAEVSGSETESGEGPCLLVFPKSKCGEPPTPGNPLKVNPLFTPWTVPFSVQDQGLNSSAIEVFVRKSARGPKTWRNMLVTQSARPIARDFTFHGDGFSYDPAHVECDWPMTAADLLEEAIEMEDIEYECERLEEQEEIMDMIRDYC